MKKKMNGYLFTITFICVKMHCVFLIQQTDS